MEDNFKFEVGISYIFSDRWLIRRNNSPFDVRSDRRFVFYYESECKAQRALKEYLSKTEKGEKYTVHRSRNYENRWVISRGIYGPIVENVPSGEGRTKAYFRTSFAAKEGICLLLLQENAHGS